MPTLIKFDGLELVETEISVRPHKSKEVTWVDRMHALVMFEESGTCGGQEV